MLKDFIALCIPVTVSCLCGSLVYLGNVLFTGYLNSEDKLAAVGLASSVQFLFNQVFLESCKGPLCSFTTQAFGKGNLRLCGIYLNRARMIQACIAVFTGIILLNSRSIMNSLG